MNNFYRKKLRFLDKRETQKNLAQALAAWREFRLKNVVQACANEEDSFRATFGLLHEIAVKQIDTMLLSDSQEEINAAAVSWYEAIREQFETTAPTGALRDALGLTGAELEKDTWARPGCFKMRESLTIASLLILELFIIIGVVNLVNQCS